MILWILLGLCIAQVLAYAVCDAQKIPYGRALILILFLGMDFIALPYLFAPKSDGREYCNNSSFFDTNKDLFIQ
jgi:hypothetical protein